MDQFLPIALVSLLLGTAIALIFFKNYFLKRKSEIGSISKPELHSDLHKKPPKPTHQSKKPLSKPHSHVSSDKDHNKKHHPLDLNTLKGHGDSVTGLCFSYDGRSLATACADGVVRVFKLDDASSKSFKFLRINVPAGGHPVAVAFSDDASSVVVASQTLSGSSLYMWGEEKVKAADDSKQQPKLPLPDIKWEHHKIHENRAVLTLFGTASTYGSGDGSTIVASCSEGTDIKIWHGKTGKVSGECRYKSIEKHHGYYIPKWTFHCCCSFYGRCEGMGDCIFKRWFCQGGSKSHAT
ncbi:hypothetical protein OIU74_011004 [Salix koriyanagi]|uniref:Transducin/WD40 repeat-like superfamily protein n=1 Tax=Salix koriyanagi TaxID=2511006 RepID=A0A9Q0YTU6_9ROSI|nr:hypothetical protein OIU74_011004 [Salix koriyanagi]